MFHSRAHLLITATGRPQKSFRKASPFFRYFVRRLASTHWTAFTPSTTLSTKQLSLFASSSVSYAKNARTKFNSVEFHVHCRGDAMLSAPIACNSRTALFVGVRFSDEARARGAEYSIGFLCCQPTNALNALRHGATEDPRVVIGARRTFTNRAFCTTTLLAVLSLFLFRFFASTRRVCVNQHRPQVAALSAARFGAQTARVDHDHHTGQNS